MMRRSAGLFRNYNPLFSLIQKSLDIAGVLACWGILTFRHVGSFPLPYQVASLLIVSLMVLIYPLAGAYQSIRMGTLAQELPALFRAWSLVVLSLITISFATKTSAIFSRETFFIWTLGGLLLQILIHWGTRVSFHQIRTQGLNTRNALLIGSGLPLFNFYNTLLQNPELGIRVVGWISCGTHAGVTDESGSSLKGFPKFLGKLDEIPAIVKHHQVDLLYLALPLEETSRITEVVRRTIPLSVDVSWVPDLSSFQLVHHGLREIAGQPILCLSDSPLDGVSRIVKTLEDYLLASLILLLTTPLLLLISLGVKISSPGPVLFKQKRGGLNGREFLVWKFRTMKVHTEDEGKVTPVARNDSRVTSFGAFLRKTSLDELPQFFNVLQGTMSIVGPRPHAIEHNEKFREELEAYMMRHRIKPGITGWAQVNGWRGSIHHTDQLKARLDFDLYYINNWSIWFDFKIIVLTLFRGLIHKDAY